MGGAALAAAVVTLPCSAYAQSTQPAQDYRTPLPTITEPQPESRATPTITEGRGERRSAPSIGGASRSGSGATSGRVGASDRLFSGPVDPDTEDAPSLARPSNGEGARVGFPQDGDIPLGRRVNERRNDGLTGLTGRRRSGRNGRVLRPGDPEAEAGQPVDGDLDEDGRFFEPRRTDIDDDLVDRFDDDLEVEPLVPAEEALTGPTVALPTLQERRDDLLERPGDPFAEERRDPLTEDHDQPYDPLGLRVGTFRVLPTLTTTGIVTDNVRNGAGKAEADVGVELRPTLRIESDWNRHSLTLDANAAADFYNEFDSENTKEYGVAVQSRIDVTRRTNVELNAGYQVQAEERGTFDSTTGAVERPDVATFEAGVILNHRFNRLVMRTRVGYSQEINGDATLGDGTVESGADDDFSGIDVAQRLTWEFSPAFAAFVEGGYNWQSYDATSGGISRDSEGYEGRIGITTEIGPAIRAELSAGYARQKAEDDRLGDLDGLLFDADVTWRPNALTTFNLTAQTDIDTSSLSGSSGSVQYQAALNVRHEFRRYAIGMLGVGWTREDFGGAGGTTEDELTFQVGGEYIFNRNLAALASYEFTDFTSSLPDSDYQVNEFRIGLQLRR